MRPRRVFAQDDAAGLVDDSIGPDRRSGLRRPSARRPAPRRPSGEQGRPSRALRPAQAHALGTLPSGPVAIRPAEDSQPARLHPVGAAQVRRDAATWAARPASGPRTGDRTSTAPCRASSGVRIRSAWGLPGVVRERLITTGSPCSSSSSTSPPKPTADLESAWAPGSPPVRRSGAKLANTARAENENTPARIRAMTAPREKRR